MGAAYLGLIDLCALLQIGSNLNPALLVAAAPELQIGENAEINGSAIKGITVRASLLLSRITQSLAQDPGADRISASQGARF